MEKSYQKVVQYVKNEIINGNLKQGDRLVSERELAEILDTSRNSVREGLRTLENLGILASQHGSGNYISSNFNKTVSELLSFMYLLQGISDDQITEFRLAIEWEAMQLAVHRVYEEEKESLRLHMEALEAADNEEERVYHDKSIHIGLVAASHNEILITNYDAINSLMDNYIKSMRAKIISGMQNKGSLMRTHRMLVEGILENDLDKGLQGLRDHFGYIDQYKGEVLI